MSAKNVALCKALGWTMRVVEDGYFRGSFSLHDPSGKLIRHGRGNNDVRIMRLTEDEAWSLAIEQRVVIDYEHDIAAGLAALSDIAISDQSVSVQIKIRANETLCGIEKGGQDVVVCYAATPAEAVFNALCAYYHVEGE